MTQAATERVSLRTRLRRAGGRAADFSQPDAAGDVREHASRIARAAELYGVLGTQA